MSLSELAPTPSTPPSALPKGSTPPKKPTKRQIRNAIKLLVEYYRIDEEHLTRITVKQLSITVDHYKIFC
jgi:hypothetical protein